MPSVARNFVRASSHVITCSIGAVGALGPGTAAAVFRHTSTAVYHGIMAAGGADPNNWVFAVNGSDKLTFYPGSVGDAPGVTSVPTGVWCLGAVTKSSSGTVAPRFHLYRYDTRVWVHEDSGTTRSGSGTPATSCALGNTNTTEYWNGDIQIAAYWNTALTDAQVEALALNGYQWRLAKPQGLWGLSQPTTGTNVVDDSGNGANQTAITGTSVVTGSPDFDAGPMIQLPHA